MGELPSKERSDLDWLRRAAESMAFGPSTKALLMPYVREIEYLRSKVEEADERRLRE
jgi:hypothetical protein